jgi:hypothetical protein
VQRRDSRSEVLSLGSRHVCPDQVASRMVTQIALHLVQWRAAAACFARPQAVLSGQPSHFHRAGALKWMPRTEYSARRRFVSDDVGEHVWTSALVNEARVLLYDLTMSCRKSPGERHLSWPTSRSGGLAEVTRSDRHAPRLRFESALTLLPPMSDSAGEMTDRTISSDDEHEVRL